MAGLSSIRAEKFEWGCTIPTKLRDEVRNIPIFNPSKPLESQVEQWKEWSANVRYLHRVHSEKLQIKAGPSNGKPIQQTQGF